MLKINHLTNLHDARFAAAEQVDCITFSFIKGHPQKISLAMYQEIVQWIAGTNVIPDFGQDIEGLQDFLERNLPYDLLQVHATVLPLLPAGLLNETIFYTVDFHKAIELIKQGFIVESPHEIDHEKHFQVVSLHQSFRPDRNFTLNHTFFDDSFQLDYERFLEWIDIKNVKNL